MAQQNKISLYPWSPLVFFTLFLFHGSRKPEVRVLQKFCIGQEAWLKLMLMEKRFIVRIGLFILLGVSGGLKIWNWELEDERSVTSQSIWEDKHNAHIRGTMMEEFRERHVKRHFVCISTTLDVQFSSSSACWESGRWAGHKAEENQDKPNFIGHLYLCPLLYPTPWQSSESNNHCFASGAQTLCKFL